VFDVHGVDRLAKWKEFRLQLEHSQTPLEDVAVFWSRAPFVSSYLNPQNPQSWPDPWHLILDERLDDLAITLGMLYTIKLTQRFMDSVCEIHMSMSQKEYNYYLVIDNMHVLNLEYGAVTAICELAKVQTSILLSVKSLP
jgi:hypothetical protein